ncbi:hypothetical protein ACC840_36770, partial [Rhizobium ruizarguesonis]
PVALLFLVAFIAYLMLALEESDTLPLAASVPLRFTLRLTAVYGALAGAAFMPELSRVGGTLLDMPALSVLIAVAQP